jgi:hypothetical protein
LIRAKQSVVARSGNITAPTRTCRRRIRLPVALGPPLGCASPAAAVTPPNGGGRSGPLAVRAEQLSNERSDLVGQLGRGLVEQPEQPEQLGEVAVLSAEIFRQVRRRRRHGPGAKLRSLARCWSLSALVSLRWLGGHAGDVQDGG